MDLIPIVLLFAVMYFVLIRPQQQRVKAQRAIVASLDVGDEVVTVGGLIGRIVRLDDDSAEVETTPGTVLRVRRSAIAGRTQPRSPLDDTGTGTGNTNDDDGVE